VTPELLASVLARYSRSNEGLGAILAKVDPANPDASIDRILKFVDYGHASIGGLTGGLAVALDDVSMWLAYKLFEIATMADGQESSSRYITLAPENLPAAEELGVPADLAPRWRAVMARAFAAYQAEYARLDALAVAEPQRVRLPAGATPAVAGRLRKNYALDRARYFIPFATRTNVGLVQTARMWAATVKQLASLPHPEARAAADLIRGELLKQSPRLMRHSQAETSHVEQAAQELARSLALGRERLSHAPLADDVWVHVDRAAPPWLAETQPVAEALRHRSNRYGQQGLATCSRGAARPTCTRCCWVPRRRSSTALTPTSSSTRPNCGPGWARISVTPSISAPPCGLSAHRCRRHGTGWSRARPSPSKRRLCRCPPRGAGLHFWP
jgi:thymidylate synthase ThyX